MKSRKAFLRYIDELTVWHIRILVLFQDPPKRSVQERRSTHQTASVEVCSDLVVEFSFPIQLWVHIFQHLRGTPCVVVRLHASSGKMR